MTTDPTAALARIRQMADHWEQHLPEVIRTPAVVSALRAALEGVVPVSSPPDDRAETEEQRADREETERDHARGDHTYCGVTCEVEMPTEQLRNFVVAKGYPGTTGALNELLRRARAEAAVAPLADRAAVLREAADIAESLRQFNHAIGARKAAQVSENVGILRVVDKLRRLADETPAAQPRRIPDCPPDCPCRAVCIGARQVGAAS